MTTWKLQHPGLGVSAGRESPRPGMRRGGHRPQPGVDDPAEEIEPCRPYATLGLDPMNVPALPPPGSGHQTRAGATTTAAPVSLLLGRRARLLARRVPSLLSFLQSSPKAAPTARGRRGEETCPGPLPSACLSPERSGVLAGETPCCGRHSAPKDRTGLRRSSGSGQRGWLRRSLDPVTAVGDTPRADNPFLEPPDRPSVPRQDLQSRIEQTEKRCPAITPIQ
jgi:hypothetical protein